MNENNTPNWQTQQPSTQAPQPTGQPPQPSGQSPQPSGQPTHPSTSGLAIAGLVLGIVAVAGSFIPIINNVAFFIGIVGLALSIAGLVSINKGKHSGRGLAIAGIALGIVSLMIVLIMQATCAAILDSSSSRSEGSTSSGASSGTSSAATMEANSSAAQSDFTVSIDDATVTKDYNGDPALLVTFSWTNNSDKARSFASALYPKCYQNGVQLDTAITMDGSNTDGYMSDVKPGSGTTVTLAYKLKDESDVEIEVSELISLDGAVLASKTVSVA